MDRATTILRQVPNPSSAGTSSNGTNFATYLRDLEACTCRAVQATYLPAS